MSRPSTSALPRSDRLHHPAALPRTVAGAPLEFDADRSYLRHLQRLLDLVVAVPALMLFGVLLPLLAVIIKYDSRGPVFYRQERIGVNRRRARLMHLGYDRRKAVTPGRPFRVWKLRTMGIDAEKNGPAWATQNDVRVTRVGRWLRQYRFDEVPQFWNVLRGEMSVVGPRPERLCFINQFEQDVTCYRDRLLVRPGITGLAQVENGYDTDLDSVRRKVALDRSYVRSAGLGTDLRILMRTVGVVLRGSGAH